MTYRSIIKLLTVTFNSRAIKLISAPSFHRSIIFDRSKTSKFRVDVIGTIGDRESDEKESGRLGDERAE